MIQISDKNEVKMLRENFPDLHIVRTVHKHYVEESRAVMEFLKAIRSPQVSNVCAQ